MARDSRRTNRARSWRATVVSGTWMMTGLPGLKPGPSVSVLDVSLSTLVRDSASAESNPTRTTAPTAPPFNASATNSCPSRAAVIAKNKSPETSERESIEKPSIRWSGAPAVTFAAHRRRNHRRRQHHHCARHLTRLRRSPTATSQRAACHFPVIEGENAVADLLILLMTFACDEHDIAGLCDIYGVLDCLTPIDHAVNLRSSIGGLDSGGNAPFDLFDDPLRVLASRVVRRDDDDVAQPGRDHTHERPFGPVAVATAAEHRDQSAAAPAVGPFRAGFSARRRCGRSRPRPSPRRRAT